MKTNFLKVAVFAASMIFQNVFYAQAQIDPSFNSGSALAHTCQDVDYYQIVEDGVVVDKILYGLNGGSMVGVVRTNLDGSQSPSDISFKINTGLTSSCDRIAVERDAQGNYTGNVFIGVNHPSTNPGVGSNVAAIRKYDQNGFEIASFLYPFGVSHHTLFFKVENGEQFLYTSINNTVRRIDAANGSVLATLNVNTIPIPATSRAFKIRSIGENRIAIVGRFNYQGNINIVITDNNLVPISPQPVIVSSISHDIRDLAVVNGNVILVGQFNNVNGVNFYNKIARFNNVGVDTYSLDPSFQVANPPVAPLIPLSSATSDPNMSWVTIEPFGCGFAVGGNVGSRGITAYNENGSSLWGITAGSSWVWEITRKFAFDGDSDVELLAVGSFSTIGNPASTRLRAVQLNGFSINPSYKYCAIPNGSFQMDYEVSSGGLQPNETQEWLLEESLDNGLTWNSLGDVFSGLEGGVITSQNGILYRLTRTVSSCATSCQFSSVFGDVQLGCGPYQVVESETKSFSTENENGTEVSTLTVFPNPFSDRMSITANEFNNDDLVDVIIFDVNGAQVYTAEKQFAGDLQNGIDVSNLAAGAYLVVLKSKTAVYSYKALKK
ncbi:MAG: T9SS type A sorting domain-containing protein [Flavobacteriales bacterium]|jgi:hypothetical protein